MKRKLFFLGIILFCKTFSFCQNFTIKINQDTITVNQGISATFQLIGIPIGGYNASIFLSLQEFQTNTVLISPPTINSPYNNCTITVQTNNCSLGTHRLIIKGEQGLLVSYDTAFVKVNFNPSLKWYQFTGNNSGLSGNIPYDIAIDKNNDIWICSDGGLTKYDRTNWYSWGNSTYKKTDFYGTIISQVTNSMINCNTWSVSIDSNNVKWIATENGLIRYNDTTHSLLFSGENIWALSCFNNKVCIGTSSNGIKYFNGNNWTSYTVSNSYLPDNSIRKLKLENDSIIWIGTSNGIARFDLNYWTIYNANNSILTNNVIASMAIDKNNNKYFSALGTGLIKFDNAIFQEFLPPCSEISAIFPDALGNVWLGFQSGNANNALVRFDGSNWQEYNSTNSGFNSSPATPGYGRIYSINKDFNGVLWIGTFGDGIFAYSESNLNSIFPSQMQGTSETISSSYKLRVYPNPAKNYIIIDANLKQKKNEIVIYNVSGQELIRQELKDNKTQIDINNLTRGVYFVKYITDNAVEVQKIIKE